MTCIHCNGTYRTPDSHVSPEPSPITIPPPVSSNPVNSLPQINPYETPKQPAFNLVTNESRLKSRRRARPHRGGIILTLGIVGFLTGLGIILGPTAWIMGKNDLNLMRRGQMDSSGRDMTQIGYTLGIITTIVGIITICLLVWWLYFLVGVVEEVDQEFNRAMQEAEEAIQEFDRDMQEILTE